MEKRPAEMSRDLERGHFVARGPAVSRRPLPIRIGEVQTSTRSTSPKLMPPPATSGDDLRDLIFAPAPAEPRRAAPPPPPPPPGVDDLLQALARRPALEPATRSEEHTSELQSLMRSS